jgi:1,2-diacylglycerol 3-alpha-glucosyltransferase
MRIGMMTDMYKPFVSGVITHISLTKRYLEKMGHEVFVFTFGEEGAKDEESNIIRSPGLPLVDTGFYLTIRYTNRAQRLLYSMDVVHLHHPFLSGRLAVRYCKPHGIPIVFTNHTRYDLYTQAYLPMIPEFVGGALLQAYLPNFFRYCDLVIAPSEGMRQVFRNLGITSPVEVVPNGVELSPFWAPVEPVPRRDLGFSEKDVLLVYTGRLGPEKNLPFLLRAFGGTAKAYKNVGLLIIGDGHERENLEDRVRHMGIADRVCFTGMIPYHDIPRYLVTADAFVTASVTEVHPFSVIEAMAAGLPVLGIDSPGIGDTVKDAVTGILVPDEDIAEFTAKMVRLVTEHKKRRNMGEQARAASADYAIERTTQMLVDHYEDLVSARISMKRSLRTRFSLFLNRLYK